MHAGSGPAAASWVHWRQPPRAPCMRFPPQPLYAGVRPEVCQLSLLISLSAHSISNDFKLATVDLPTWQEYVTWFWPCLVPARNLARTFLERKITHAWSTKAVFRCFAKKIAMESCEFKVLNEVYL